MNSSSVISSGSRMKESMAGSSARRISSRAISRPAARRSEVASDASSGGKTVWLTLMPMPAMARPAGELHQDAGDFAAVEHEVVGPAQVADQVGGLDDGVLRGQAQGQGEDGRGRENHGTVDAGAGFGVPGVAVASLAGGLAIGQDDGSGLEGGGGAHGGIDLGVVVDAALGEGFVEKRDVHQAETPLTRSKERGLPSLLDGAWKLLDAEARSRGAKPR